jgi:hypothetical protein
VTDDEREQSRSHFIAGCITAYFAPKESSMVMGAFGSFLVIASKKGVFQA